MRLELEQISASARAMSEVITTLVDVARDRAAAGVASTSHASDVVERVRELVPPDLVFVDETRTSWRGSRGRQSLVVRTLAPWSTTPQRTRARRSPSAPPTPRPRSSSASPTTVRASPPSCATHSSRWAHPAEAGPASDWASPNASLNPWEAASPLRRRAPARPSSCASRVPEAPVRLLAGWPRERAAHDATSTHLHDHGAADAQQGP